MSMHFYIWAIAVIALAGTASFLWRIRRRSFNVYADSKEETLLALSWDDLLASELSARIFNPEDSDFVTRESSRRISQSFRTERTALALQWLLEVRRHVYLLMRAHLRAARSNLEIKPAGELRLGFEFLLFQVTSRILYLVIWLIGPLHAATLVGYSLKLAETLRKMTDGIVTGSTQVAAELLDSDPQTKNRTASV